MGDRTTIPSYKGGSHTPAHTMVCAVVSQSQYGNVSKMLFFLPEGSFDRLAYFFHISVQESKE